MAEGEICDVFRSLTCSDDKKKTTLLLLELIHLRFHFFRLSFPSFLRCIPLPLEPAFIIVTLSTFTLHHSLSASKPWFFPRIYISPSHPLQLPFSPPTPTNQPPPPPPSTQPASKTLLIPAPPSPTSIPPNHCKTYAQKHILPPFDTKKKRQSATGCRSMRLEEVDVMVRMLRRG
jgi:hypothetical protein